ncbi:MAG: hypothetical protein ACTSU8_03035 [Alphaproteobacteria bacterium]
MKKTIIMALLAITIAVPGAFAQMTRAERNAKAYKQLVDQYATVTLGFLIEDRCRQLAQVGYDDFINNQKILNEFMSGLMGQTAWQNLLVGLDQTAQDAETNPCNSDTFKFAIATSQISSKMATRVQLLDPADYPRLVEENQSQPQEESLSAQQDNPQVEPQVEVQPVDNPPEPIPETTFAPITTTQVTRQPEAEKPKQQQAATSQADPVPQTQQVQQQTSTQTGIPLSNYVNPYPYSSPAAPAGETEKLMKRRHRQEIIDLRRAQRAELDIFKDNRDNYIDQKAVKKAIEQRHSAEYTAMRNRHLQELRVF